MPFIWCNVTLTQTGRHWCRSGLTFTNHSPRGVSLNVGSLPIMEEKVTYVLLVILLTYGEVMCRTLQRARIMCTIKSYKSACGPPVLLIW